jgi:hypothetical protein
VEVPSRCLVVFVAITAIGCGDNAAPVEPPGSACVAQPLTEPLDCLSDGNCPCGAHCELGACVASCSSDADCGDGQRCDSYGRCRLADRTSSIPRAPQTLGGTLRAPARIVMPTSGVARVTLRASSLDVPRARVAARAGAEVRCSDTGAFGSECLLAAIPADGTADIDLRRATSANALDAAQVTVITDANRATITIAPAAPAQALPPLVAGRYRGVGWVTKTGTGTVADPGPAPSTRVELPFEAEVYASGDATVTLAITSPYGALTSAPQLIGTATLAEATDGSLAGTAAFPAHPFATGSLSAKDWALVASVPAAEARFSNDTGMLSLALVEELRGTGSTARPLVAWQLELARVGEPSGAAAPAIPPAATLPYNENTHRMQLFAWELAAQQAFPTYGSLTHAERRGYNGHLFGEPPRLDACVGALDGYIEIGRYGLGMYPGSGSLSPRPSGAEGWQRLFDLLQFKAGGYRIDGFRVDSVNLLSPAATMNGRIPCRSVRGSLEFDIDPTSFAGANEVFTNRPSGQSIGQLDTCAALAASTGCSIQDVERTVSFVGAGTVRYSPLAGGPAVDSSANFELRFDVDRECVPPQVPLACGESFACTEPAPTGTTVESLAASMFGTTRAPISSDLTCAAGGRSAAIDLDLAADAGTGATRDIAFNACLDDLARLREEPPQVGAARYGEALAIVFGTGTGCLDPGRFINTLATTLYSDRRRDVITATPLRYAASTYGYRLLGRWLDVHGFIATEAIEREALAGVLRGEGAGTTPLSTAVAASLGAWDLLFHPRIASALDAAPAVTLAQPDYRTHRTGAPSLASDDQRMGLSSKILATLASQAKLLEATLDKTALRGEPVPDAQLASFVGRLLVARAIAFGLEQRAVADDPALTWADRHASAEQQLAAALAGMLQRAEALRAGVHPLGLGEDDLPLYFLADDTVGSGGRFAAVSDFLLGTGPSSSAWAPVLVRQAREALTSARTAYADELDRQFRGAVSQQEFDIYVGDTAYDYDIQLRAFCGPSTASHVSDPAFSSATCYRSSDPGCSVDLEAYSRAWRGADLYANACVAAKLAPTASIPSLFAEGATSAFFAACWSAPVAAGTLPNVTLEPCGGGSCARCVEGGTTHTLPLTPSTFQILASRIPPNGLREIIDECEGAGGRVAVPTPAPAKPLAQCVSGTLGEATLATHTAARDVEIARQELADFTERYGIAMETCHILARGKAQLQTTLDNFNARMFDLRIARSAADGAATVAQTVSECASTAAGASTDTPWGAAAGGIATTVSCVAGGIAAGATVASQQLSRIMDDAQGSHDRDLALLDAEQQLQTCYNDARLELVGARGAALRIEQAAQDLEAAHASLMSQLAEAQILHDEGLAYIESLEAARLTTPDGRPWLDDAIEHYTRSMRAARRATYLAVRAVEYEFQQSLGARAAVLAAETPAELEAVLGALWTAAGTRTINGSRPSDLHIVLSLRDDVLRLGDESTLPSELRPLDPAGRLRERLLAHEYAVYAEDGAYLGQRIPFTLAPLQAFGFPSNGVSIFATNDCAERLWSVNASILGTDVYSGSATTFARVDLLKQNAFFSQWCGAAPADQPFQLASVRPARNLFQEPGQASTVGTDLGVAQGERLTSRARIQAYFNVSRADFEQQSYANGDTSELAGRGLYGAYELFIPASILAAEAGGGQYSQGLVLDRVDDILLRFDYVSVAR